MPEIGIKLLFLVAVLSTTGCLPPKHLPDPKPQAEKPARVHDKWDLLNPYPNLKAPDFQKEIVQLESLIDKNPDPALLAKLHLRLGLLHLDGKNPNPDYLTAVKELEVYTALEPDGQKKEEIRNLVLMLQEMRKVSEENKRIKAKADQLAQENQETRKENQELKKNVEQLRYLVEQLKSLDIKIEERRKKIK